MIPVPESVFNQMADALLREDIKKEVELLRKDSRRLAEQEAAIEAGIIAYLKKEAKRLSDENESSDAFAAWYEEKVGVSLEAAKRGGVYDLELLEEAWNYRPDNTH